MKIDDRVQTKTGATGTVKSEVQDGRVFVKTDSGSSGWMDPADLTPAQAKAWPPETEHKARA